MGKMKFGPLRVLYRSFSPIIYKKRMCPRMKRNRKMILTLTLSLLFLFTCSLLTFFATEADNGSVANVDRMGGNTAVVTSAEAETLSRSYTWEYQTGQYFNSKVTEPCACHGTGACPYGSLCTCLVVNGSYQCCGYAQLVFHQLTGYYPDQSNYVNVFLDSDSYEPLDSSDTSQWQTLHCPIYLKLKGRHTNPHHYICVIEMTANGLFFCEANGAGSAYACIVNNEQYMTYPDFFANYNQVSKVIAARHQYTSYVNLGTKHKRSCTVCLEEYTEYHALGSSNCTVCGFSNAHHYHSTGYRAGTNGHWTMCYDCDEQLSETVGHTFVRHVCVCGATDALINKHPQVPELN